MRKNKIITILLFALCMVLLFVGCAKKNNDGVGTEEQTKNNSSINNNSQNIPSDDLDKSTLSIYPGSKTIAEVVMGTYIDGKQSEVCTVKLPGEYAVSAAYTAESGTSTPMSEMVGFVGNVISTSAYKQSSVFPTTIALSAPGNTNNDFMMSIVSSKLWSVDAVKKEKTDGIDIRANTEHPAYIYEDEGVYSSVWVYELNDDWILVIKNGGDILDSMSLNEFGESLYDVVTPVE